MKFLLFLPAIFWLLASGLFNMIGEYFSKSWGNNPSWKTMLLVALSYVVSSILWLPAMLHKNQLSVMGTAWILIALLSTLLLGFFGFHEQLSTTQLVGVCLALIAVLFLVF